MFLHYASVLRWVDRRVPPAQGWYEPGAVFKYQAWIPDDTSWAAQWHARPHRCGGKRTPLRADGSCQVQDHFFSWRRGRIGVQDLGWVQHFPLSWSRTNLCTDQRFFHVRTTSLSFSGFFGILLLLFTKVCLLSFFTGHEHQEEEEEERTA